MKPCVAIITGASQGIGRATALRLANDFPGIVFATNTMDKMTPSQMSHMQSNSMSMAGSSTNNMTSNDMNMSHAPQTSNMMSGYDYYQSTQMNDITANSMK